jgi:hypothetical protein
MMLPRCGTLLTFVRLFLWHQTPAPRVRVGWLLRLTEGNNTTLFRQRRGAPSRVFFVGKCSRRYGDGNEWVQPGSLRVRGIRGATCAAGNSEEAILAATRELLYTMIQANGIDPDDVASATLRRRST